MFYLIHLSHGYYETTDTQTLQDDEQHTPDTK